MARFWYDTLDLPAGVKATVVDRSILGSGFEGARFVFTDTAQARELMYALDRAANRLGDSIKKAEIIDLGELIVSAFGMDDNWATLGEGLTFTGDDGLASLIEKRYPPKK